MAIRDPLSQRLFVDAAFAPGAIVALSEDQTHYLVNVLRQKPGAQILVFNGRDGEWSAVLREIKKRSATIEVARQVRPQISGPDIVYAFAPLKRARLDYMVQKATELGVAALQPVLTKFTLAERVNLDRMRANVVEAAEQCGVLWTPDVRAPISFQHFLDNWPFERPLIFCDEGAAAARPIDALERIASPSVGVLIGPEGGFSEDERQTLLRLDFVHPLSLGPRIMRADTAAVAALTLVNATLGDWR
jgi:16S rRNA (uracil1498-N3)-methyltransferase